MRWWVALPLFAALAAGAVGCRSCDRVEAELRAREQDVRTLKDENSRLDCLNHAMERELAAMRGLPGPDGVIEKPSEPYPVRSLVVGRQTGGRSGDGCGLDDGLTVVVEPRDCDGQAIKAPGALLVELYERPEEGEVRFLWRWEVTPDQLRCSWQNGLFSTGYRLEFDFKTWPTTPRLRVVAKFRMINGRLFVADRDFVVRLPPERARRPLPAPTPVPSPGEEKPPQEEKLPPPKMDPAPKEVLPRPAEVPGKPAPVPPANPENNPPPKKKPGEETPGPILTHAKAQKPIVEMFRPVPMVLDP